MTFKILVSENCVNWTKIEPLVMQKLIDGRLVSGGRDVRAETEDAALHLRVGMIQAAGQLSVVP